MSRNKKAHIPKKNFLSSRLAARRLECAPDYISKLAREGKLDGYQVDRVWFVSLASVRRFEAERAEAKALRSEELVAERRKEVVASPSRPRTRTATYTAVLTGLGLMLVLNIAFAQSVGIGNLAARTMGASLAQIESPFFAPGGGSINLSGVGEFFRSMGSALRAFASRGAAETPVAQQTPNVVNNTTNNTTNNYVTNYNTNNTTNHNDTYVVGGGGDTAGMAKFETELNSLRSEIFSRSGSGGLPSTGGVINNIALMQRIDRLSGVTILNSTVNGLSGLTDADIPDTITVAGYLSTSGFTQGDLIYANSSGSLTSLGVGSAGQVLKVQGGVPVWGTDLSGSGGASAWATSTDNLSVYTADPSQVVLIGASATTTTGNIFEVAGGSLFRGALTAYGAITAPRFVATSSTASSFTYASSTSFTVSGTGFFGTASTTNLLAQNATSTNLSTTNASTTNLVVSSLGSAAGSCLTVDASGTVTTTSCGSGGTFPFTPTTNYGAAAVATSTPVWFQAGLQASSTSHFVYASSTALTVSGTGFFGTASTTNLTISSIASGNLLKTTTAGVVTAAIAGTDYENPLTFTYPLVRSTNTISLAFGTTTSNLWAGTQTFGNLIATNATTTNATSTNLSTTNASTTNLTISGLASTLLSTNSSGVAQTTTVSAPLSFSGSTLSITQANSSTNGYLSSTDWSVFNNKISSSSLSAGSGISYNSSTGVIANTIGYPFTPTTNYGASAQATSSVVWFQSGLQASSTSHFVYASSTALTVVGTGYFGTASATNLFSTNATTTYATSTNLSTTNASTTNLVVSALGSSAGQCLTVSSSGQLVATTCSSGDSFPFTPTTNYGAAAVATSTPVWFQAGLQASSTARFVGINSDFATTTYASTTALTVSGTFWGANLSTCNGASTDKLLWANGQFSCGTDQNSGGSGGSEINWAWFNGSGIRLGTTTNQVLVGHTSTTSLAALEVIRQGTNPAAYFSGNVGVGTTSPYAMLSVAGQVVGQYFTATSTSATNTFPLLTATTATTTNLAVTSVTSTLLKTNSLGQVTAAVAGTDYSNFAWPFTPTTNYGAAAVSTSTPVWFTNGLQASSTSHFVYASSTALTVSGTGFFGTASTTNLTVSALPSTLLSTNSSGVAQSTTVSAPLSFSGSTLSITQATNSTNGYLSSTDWNIFNQKVSSSSLDALYPFALTGNATSTLTQFNGGLTAYASSTIGSGTRGGGLTVSGGATTTLHAYFASTAGVGTSTPSYTGNIFAVQASSTSGRMVLIDNTSTTAWSGGTTGGLLVLRSATDNTSGGNYVINYMGGSSESTNFAVDAAGRVFVPTGGTQSSPTYSFLTDTNTGIFADGNDTLSITTGGTERFRVDATGNVGIGTTSPYAKLSVAGQGVFNRDVRADYYTATSTTVASTFIYASSTALTVSGTGFFSTASTTNLTVSALPATLISTNATGVAQTTTVSSPLSFSGSTLSISQATASTNGYLSSTDWSVFNNKISSSSLSATFPLEYNSSTGAFTYGGISTSSAVTIGQLSYWTSANTLGSVATGSVSGSSQVSVTAGRSVIGGSLAIDIVADSIGDTQLAFNTGQNLTTGSSPTFAGLTTTYSTTTNLAVTSVTSTLLKTNSLGQVTAAVAGTDYSNFAWPFTPTTNYGAAAVSTSTPVWFTNGLQASSTSHFVYASSTALTVSGHFFGANLTTCASTADKLLWTAGQFSCGTDQSGTGATEINWAYFNGSGVRLGTTTNQVLIGATATSSGVVPLAALNVIGGAGFDRATSTSFFATTASSTNLTVGQNAIVYGNVGIGSSSPWAALSVGGGLIVQTAGTSSLATSTATTDHSYASVVSGRYLYVADNGAGVKIFDNANPRQMVQVGSYTGISGAVSIAVAGRYAYVGDTAAGLKILDVSNPSAPTVVGSFAGALDIYGIALSGKYVFITDSSGGGRVRIIDVSDPRAPRLAGNYAAGGQPYGLALSGKYLYVANQGAGTVQIADISNVQAPVTVGTYTGVAPTGIAVSGRYAYVADAGGGLRILNVGNPASPALLSTYGSGGDFYGVAIAGDYAYVADFGGTFRVVDIRNPALPRAVATSTFATGARSVALGGRYAYVSASDGGVQAMDISGVETPAARIGALEAGEGNVNNDLRVGNNIYAGGGLDVGISGIFSRGPIAAFISSTTESGTTSPVVATLMGGNVGIGTSSPYAALAVAGRGVFNRDVQADYFTATSTSVASTFTYASSTALTVSGTGFFGNLFATASSTIGSGAQAGGLTINGGATTTGNLVVQGTGTSTFAGGLQVRSLNVTSTTATSTFANGIDLSAGCFAISGACVLSTGLQAGDQDTLVNASVEALQIASSTAKHVNLVNGVADSFGSNSTSNLAKVDTGNSINLYTGEAGVIRVATSTVTTETFTANGTFNVPAGITTVSYVLVGGGGTGGAGSGGGGGGGQVIFASASTSVPGAAWSIVIGSGGNNSTMNGVTALKGSNGSSVGCTISAASGGTSGSGNAGGSGTTAGYVGAGGGGGDSAVGGNAAGGSGGAGGAGTTVSIGGSSFTYGGGGGGGSNGSAGSGGSGGGGNGGAGDNGNGTAGTANTGGGGGGGSYCAGSGASGGSGIAKVSYTSVLPTHTTLISNTFTATSSPATARLFITAATSSTFGLNTDLRAAVSRDGGTTWATTTLVALGAQLEDGTRLYGDTSVNLSTQPSGTSIKYRIIMTSTKFIAIHGVSLQWGDLTGLSASNLSVAGTFSSAATTTLGLGGGNIGIGTTSPTNTLSVSGSGYFSGFLGIGTNSQGNGARLNIFEDFSAYASTTNNQAHIRLTAPNATGELTGMEFDNTSGANPAFFGTVQTSGSTRDFVFQGYNGSSYQEHMRVTAAGFVGIGTSSPRSLLTVNGTGGGNLFTISRTKSTDTVQMRFSTNDTDLAYIGMSRADGSGLVTSGLANSLVIRSEAATHISSGSTISTTFATNGFVGIGHTAPARALSVNGLIQATDSTAGFGSGDGFMFYNSGSTALINNQESGPIQFYTGGSHRATIDATGFGVGITPRAALDVQTGSATGLIVDTPGQYNIKFYASASLAGSIGANSSYIAIFNDEADNATYAIDTNGAVTVFSDERLKKDIETLAPADALTSIMGLRPVSYHVRDGSSSTKRQIGFIAQEIEQYFPDLVSIMGTSTVVLDDGTIETITDTKGLNYVSLVPPTIAAVQQLNLNLEALASSTAASSSPQAQAFAQGFFSNLFSRMSAWLADSGNGILNLFAQTITATVVNAETVNTKQLCIEGLCVTKTQLEGLLNGAGAGGGSGSGGSSGGEGGGAGEGGEGAADTEAPVITLSGDNPAAVEVGASYIDLGATITDNVDQNLGFVVSLNGGATTTLDQISVDTSVGATHYLLFSAQDQAGNVGTATRTIIVGSGE